jgi:hypothetical protein
VLAFCRRRGVSGDYLHYWHRRFVTEFGTWPFVELRATSIVAAGPTRRSWTAIPLCGGVWLEVNDGFDASLLHSVAEALS